MLNGMKMSAGDVEVADGGKLEAGVPSRRQPNRHGLQDDRCPARAAAAAKRISNEQVAVLMSKVSDLIESYHKSLSLQLAGALHPPASPSPSPCCGPTLSGQSSPSTSSTTTLRESSALPCPLPPWSPAVAEPVAD